MNRLNNSFGQNAVRILGVLFLVSLLTPRHFASGETVRFAGDSDFVGDAGRWTRSVSEEWAKKTNNTLEYISRPADATATLQLHVTTTDFQSALSEDHHRPALHLALSKYPNLKQLS